MTKRIGSGFWLLTTDYRLLYPRGVQLLVLLLVVILIWLAVLQLQYLRFFQRFWRLMRGVRGDSLEQLLIEHLKHLTGSMEEIAKVKEAYTYLEAMTTRSIQKVGLVRFNPFSDTGSDQSFALALLDLYDNGVVVSSIHGRQGTRIYAKPVRGGESGNHLSAEELEAISQARRQGDEQRKVAEGKK